MSIGTTYRTYTFRLYPNHQQEFKLVDTIRANCAVYNELLPLVRKGVFSRNELNYALTELKEEQQWLRAYHSKMLQMISTRLAASVKSLNEKKKRGYMVGEIHHSPSEQFSSFTYNQSGFKIEKHGDTNLLWLSKIGYMEIRLHMNIDRIKQVTVIQRNKKWYALLVCIFSRPITMFINPTKSIGIDVGIKKFCHDSQNRAIENPLYLSNKLRRLKRSSRTLSHRLKNSRNMRKAKSRLQILHARIRNKRRDFLHKASCYYSKEYDIIFLERLRTLNMVRNHHLARHILDSGWRTFKNQLTYKAKMIVEVNPSSTSVDCSRCNNRVAKSLAVRTHRCDKCGLIMDRDYNASLNILRRGISLLPQGLREFTPVEILGESMKQETELPLDTGRVPHSISRLVKFVSLSPR